MQSSFIKIFKGMIVVSLLTWSSVAQAEDSERFDPPAVYLTWQQDPTTTMTVHWHTEREADRDLAVHYGKQVHDDDDWRIATGSMRPMPYIEGRKVHTAELARLSPATVYAFRIGREGRTFHFRTMPAELDEPIRFIVGGDTMFGGRFRQMNEQAAVYDPMFAVIGGDLAYCDGRPDRADRWPTFFRNWQETMVTSDGLMVPIIVALGNHDTVIGSVYSPRGDGLPVGGMDSALRKLQRLERVRSGEGRPEPTGTEADAPYVFASFAFPPLPGYGVLDFGDYMSFIVLDSGHMQPIEGRQTIWLAEMLAARENVPHLFPVYHAPAYPSYRSLHSEHERRVRAHWVPLFEEFGVRIAFEKHDHAYKRTHPIRDGLINEDGIYFLGDGAWGVSLRTPRTPEQAWFLARSEELNHVYVVTIEQERRHFKAVDIDGRVFDEFHLDAREPIRVVSPADEASSDE